MEIDDTIEILKYFSFIRNYVLSVSSQRKYNFCYQNTFLDAFQTNSRNIIGRNPWMVIPLLANQDLTFLFLLFYCLTGFVRVLESFRTLWKLMIPCSRTWEVSEKGGFSKWLWRSYGFLFGKILEYPEMDITPYMLYLFILLFVV